jgi:hypothetical protein
MPSATARKSVQKKQDVQPSELNPRTTTFEFFGMPGAIGIMIMCYTIFYVFYTNCDEKGCPGEPGIDWLWEHPIHLPLGLQSVYHHVGLEIYAGWLAWLIALFYLLPGKWVKGTQLRNSHLQNQCTSNIDCDRYCLFYWSLLYWSRTIYFCL